MVSQEDILGILREERRWMSIKEITDIFAETNPRTPRDTMRQNVTCALGQLFNRWGDVVGIEKKYRMMRVDDAKIVFVSHPLYNARHEARVKRVAFYRVRA